jgi:hypothetical protein
MTRRHVLALALLASAAACGDAAVARESAGPPQWRVSAEPVVSIGVADGDPHYQLYNVAAATRLPDGSIAVLNQGSQSVSVFDRKGTFLRTAGRKGQGPGEFEAPSWAGRAGGDTLAVWDARLKRVSFFRASTGEYVRGVTVNEANGMFPAIVGRFGDGSLALDVGPDVFAMSRGERGLRRDPVTLRRVTPDGRTAGVLATFPGTEVFVSDHGASGFAWDDAPFGRPSYSAVGGTRLYVADGGTGEISIYSLTGQRTGTLRTPFSGWRIGSDDTEQYRRAKLDPIVDASRRREVQAALEAAPVPGVAPSLGGLRVDADENVWVQAYPRPADTERSWMVLSAAGAPIGAVTVPGGLQVMEVGAEYLLGVRRDELGVEKVEMYSLARTAQ